MGQRVRELLKEFSEVSSGSRLFGFGPGRLSQNSVAASMDLDPSTLSQIVRGRRNFTPAQLEAFIRVVRLSPSDAWRLQEAFVADGMGGPPPVPWGASPDVLAEIHEQLETCKDLGRCGAPDAALRWLEAIGKSTDKLLGSRLPDHMERDLQRQRAEIHLARAYALEYVHGGREIEILAQSDYQGVERISQELGDPGLQSRLEIHQAVVAYISGRFDAAIMMIENVRQKGNIPGDEYVLFANRVLILSLAHAYRADQDARGEPFGRASAGDTTVRRITELDAEMQEVLASGAYGDRRHEAMYLEGFARAVGLLGDRGQAFDLLLRGEQCLKTSEETRTGPWLLVRTQFGRSWVDVLSRGPREHDDLMHERADETSRIARDRYPRYVWLVDDLLSRATPSRID